MPDRGQGGLFLHLVVCDAAFMHLVGDRDLHGRTTAAGQATLDFLAASELPLQRANGKAALESRKQGSTFDDDGSAASLAMHVQSEIFLNEISDSEHISYLDIDAGPRNGSSPAWATRWRRTV